MSRNLPKVLQIGLVGWWDSAGKDLSGNGNNGTLVNSPTKVRRLQNDGLSYNGTNQYIDIGNMGYTGATANFSFSCFLKINTFPTSGNRGYINQIVDSSTSSDFQGWIMNTAGVYSIGFGRGKFNVSYACSVNYGFISDRYYHIGITQSGDTNKLYINGVLISTSTVTGNGTLGSNIGYIGLGLPSAYGAFNIINPMVYNKELSQKEIELLYNSLYIK